MAVHMPLMQHRVKPDSISSVDDKSTGSSGISTVGTSATTGLSDMLKRLTRTSTTKSITTMTSEISGVGLTWTKKKSMAIFLTAPHYVAGGQLSGTVVLELQSVHLEGWQSLTLNLVGREAVTNSSHGHEYKLQFLNQPVLSCESSMDFIINESKIVVPFVTQLPPDLNGSYKDKKGSIDYLLQSELTYHSPTTASPSKHIQADCAVEIYANINLRSIADAAALYTPVHESHRLWRALNKRCLTLDLTLSRTVWVSGSPIYLSVKAHNASKEKVCNMTLALLRREKTFLPENDGFAPASLVCEVVAQSSLAETDWWQQLDPGMAGYRQIVIAVQSLQTHVSVRNRSLFNISYSLRMSVSSHTSTETVLEIPIVLVHPVSMDPPPPGPYVIQTEETDATFARELLFNPTQEEERVEYNHDEERPRSSLPEGTTEGALVAPTPDRQPWKPLNKVKRKVSRWGVRLRPPGSLSNKEEVTTPTNEVVKSSSSHTTELYKTTGTALPTDIQHLRPEQLRSASSWTHLHQLIPATQLTQRRNTVREIIRFGHVRAAKQYGKQHGSMGNAGLDIRNMFNVPTAREAWQSCQAKVSFL